MPDINHLPPRIQEIVRQVAKEHEVSIQEMLSHRCFKPLAYARFDAWWRIRQARGPGGFIASFSQIGRWFGRDHASIYHGVNRWEEMNPLLVAMEKAA